MSDDFFIPSGDEIDRGAVPDKRRRKPRLRKRPNDKGPEKRRNQPIDVPQHVGVDKNVRGSKRSRRAGDDFIDTGSTGRVVRSIDASSAAARREFVIPPELREKYGLDD